MQSKLNQSQIEKVRKKYHDHPLYVSCKKAFGYYEADMTRLLFSPEEMFLEVSIILDSILTNPNAAKSYADNLWNELKVKIRRWSPEATQDDLNKVSGGILYVVAAVLCQHENGFFSDEVKDAILVPVHSKMPIEASEARRIVKELSDCADGLSQWFSLYKTEGNLLSVEILATTISSDTKRPKKAGKTSKPTSKERETMTFKKKNSVLKEHLKLLFLKLTNEGWIDGNDVDFIALFSGKRDSDCVVTWKGKYGKGTLVELFKSLCDNGLIQIPKGFTLSSILEGHFQDASGNWLKGLDKGNGPNNKALPVIDECVRILNISQNNDIFEGDDAPDIIAEYDKDSMFTL